MKCEYQLEENFYGTATVGERGQVVIPAEARKKFHMNPGDKVLVMGHPAGGVILCKIDVMRDVFFTLLNSLERLESKIDTTSEE